MKTMRMTELKKGDLFAYSIQGKGRRSFTVIDVLEQHVIIQETVDLDFKHARQNKPVKKKISNYVYLLRDK